MPSSRSMIRTRSSADSRRARRAYSIAGACRLLRARSGLRVCLVLSDWETVDLARAQAAALGLDDRLSIHHALALSADVTN
ncbi:MAG: hypothetical protein JNK58_14100 [Phycisphaerae bacterium]|nr:hypothetical protein [Phycisphaerae bacterium]